MSIWEWPEAEFLDPRLDTEQQEILAILRSLFPGGLAGRRVLEPGAGTGRVSFHLHTLGARTVLSDLSENAVTGARMRFAHAGAGAPLGVVHADLACLPFADRSFDLVWNSGVMEHFAPDALVVGLREMARVSNQLIAVFVPHAFCVPYAIARLLAVDAGTWRWGFEDPKRTLRGAFFEAGLEVIDEFDFGHETTIPLSYLPLLPDALAGQFRRDFERHGRWANGISLATVGIARH